MRTSLPIALMAIGLLAGCSASPSEAGKVQSEVLYRTSASWDGTPYPAYPEGQPVLSLVKVSIPANTTLDWHCHQGFNLGYLAEGKLEVETRDGKQIHLKAGDTLAELVNEVHRGHTREQAATVMVFHAATEQLAFSTPEAQCPTPFNADDSALNTLLKGIEQRLTTAQDVALHKWDNAQPVYAQQRERQVLANVRNNAWRYQLTPERAQAFFADQIEAHKMVQYSLINRWQVQGEAPDTPRRDLEQAVRPQLDDLQAVLLQSLANFDNAYRPDCASRLAATIDARATDPGLKQALVRATGQLCQTP